MARHPGRHVGAPAIGMALVALGAGLSLLRQRGAGALDTLWAEDGTIFLTAALRDASPLTWFEGYAGYMHLAPRALASLAAWLPLDWASEVMAWGAALSIGAVAIVTYRAQAEHIPGAGVRLVLALAVILLPSAGIEVSNSAANIHWYLLYAGSWVVLWSPTERFDRAAGCALLFLAAASDPFAVLFGPFLALRAYQRRRRIDFLFTGALAFGLAVQAAVVLASAGSRPLDPFGTAVTDVARWYGFHVLQTAVFGVTLREWVLERLGVVAGAALALLVLAVLLAPAARSALAAPRVPLVLAVLHVALFVAPVLLAGFSTSRYTVAPILLLYSIVAWGLSQAGPEVGRALGAAAAGLLAILAVLDFAPANRRAAGPRWTTELVDARGDCTERAGNAVLVIPPLPTPDRDDPTRTSRLWDVQVPCARLLAMEQAVPVAAPISGAGR